MSDTPSQYLSTRETAAVLGLRPRTLDRYRVSGEGPVFHKFGARVCYARAELDAWAASRRRASTSDPGGAGPRRCSITPTRARSTPRSRSANAAGRWGVRPSTGSVGDCYDNAMAESFFATLECELIDQRSFRTRAQAKRAVFDFVEGWYNTGPRHSALEHLSPNDFERATAEPQPAVAPFPNVRPEARNHPRGRPHTPVHEETSTLSALAHHHTPGESRHLSTRPG